ncbi:MAG: molecular chaperone TorD family protein [Planctomycetes bacterium]|nr:molecular chaperone TorD family protein [Planctomycetota bacterium]
MNTKFQVLKLFASLLRYPGREYASTVESLLDELDESSPAHTALNELLKFVRGKSRLQLEEEFTHTFDINAAVSLDVGFHLFGLAYKRGEFLVKVREALREAGLNEGTELPDHLPNLLELAAAMDEERATALVQECIFPAIQRMTGVVTAGGFHLALIALRVFLDEHFRCVVLLFEQSDEARAATGDYVYAPMELDELQTGVARHE